MKKVVFAFLFCINLCSGVFAQKAEIRSGVVGGVSMNWLHSDYYPTTRVFLIPDKSVSFQVGYQFQFDFQKPWGIDAALLYGQRRCKVNEGYGAASNNQDKLPGNYLALNGVFNYRVIPNLKLGVGVEPTIYFKNHDVAEFPVKSAFDAPLVVKAAYSFKYFDVVLSYKHGFCNVMKDIPSINKSVTRDVQLSIFVPIFHH